ncbi:MAG: hypothetical protein EHM33_04060 [Chloroflexi bacterium]|nr:MAG: hypothetical protein EHM33_04060 [Chloroflexota bacterium]
MDEQALIYVLVLLLLLSNAHSLFGKNIPRFVWWLSLSSAAAIGFVVGIFMAPFPEDLLIGSLISLGAIVFFFISRAIRDRHPT